MRYFIRLSYNGKNYKGWQRQPKAPSVQEEVENALSLLLRTEIAIVGAGRTDTGVHARDYFAHFDLDTSLPENLVNKLNSFLPKEIAIKDIFPVKDDAHARFDALSRTYQYFISLEKDPFLYEQHYYVYQSLDLIQMNKACEILLRHTDFQCFSKTHTDALARVMRKESKKRGLADFRVLYSPEPARPVFAPEGATGKSAKLGTMSYYPPIMGQMIASDVILHLSGLDHE